MNYLLDTNIIIFFFKDKFGITDKMDSVGIENCYISEITLAELKFGAVNSQNPQKHIKEIDKLLEFISIIPITSAIDLYATEKARLRKAGTPPNDFDLLIGCTAVENEMILVTNNTKDFQRIKTIQLEDWKTIT